MIQNYFKFLNKFKTFQWEWVILAFILVFSGLVHGINMYHFPYFENDEGTYMSQAWSILTQGKLAPYTYWYDHAPAGWILIAIWVQLTGGFYTFGTSVDSGRTLMLALHIFSTLFLYLITRKLTGKVWPAILACLIFSISPLQVYFGRRVLLDNIMTFWVLFSFWWLIRVPLKLRYVYASAITFAISVLTKENAIFFLPGFLYLIFNKISPHQKRFAIIKWIAVSFAIISFYVFYAIINSEFLPQNGNHVSLLTTLYDQLSRGSNLPFWNPQSDFIQNYFEWIKKDPYIIPLGLIVTVICLPLSIFVKRLRLPTIFISLFWLFLIRGGLVIEFYILPIIPFIAILSAMFFDLIASFFSFYWVERIKKSKIDQILYGFYMLLLVMLLGCFYQQLPLTEFTKNETESQIEAIAWIKQNVLPNESIIIDCYAYIELHQPGYINQVIYPKADWFWKFTADPEIFNVKFHGDWKNIDYIALSHEMLKQIHQGNHPALKEAFINSKQVVDFSSYMTSFRDLPQMVSTNGDWMSIYKRRDVTEIVRDNAWTFYKQNFIHSYGQVIDPANGNTTSEGQSYALLRAVQLDDQATFKGVWAWTKDHMQFRTQDKLFSWLTKESRGQYQVTDSNTASDADQDIALSLLFAYKKWGDINYLKSSEQIIHDIWTKEVVKIGDHYYLTSAAGSNYEQGYLLNPSYLSPAYYKIFAQVDPNHPWLNLSDDSYDLLNQIQSDPQNSSKLIPNWLYVTNSGKIQPVKPDFGQDAGNYGFDSFRTYFRIALDYEWFKDPRSRSFLLEAQPFFQSQSSIVAVYSLSGTQEVNYQSLATLSGPLAIYHVTDPAKAQQFYQTNFVKKYSDQGYWSDKNNYYDQNWAYFSSSLATNNYRNLWK